MSVDFRELLAAKVAEEEQEVAALRDELYHRQPLPPREAAIRRALDLCDERVACLLWCQRVYEELQRRPCPTGGV